MAQPGRRKRNTGFFSELMRSHLIAAPNWRELMALHSYRCALGLLAVALTFGAYDREWVRFEDLHITRALGLGYLGAAVVLLLYALNDRLSRQGQLLLGVILDIAVMSTAMLFTRGLEGMLPLLLLVSLAGAANFLPMRLAMGMAAFAVIGMQAAMISHGLGDGITKAGADAAVFGVATFVVAAIASLLGERVREAEALAARRRMELLDMDRLNDLVVHRMRTGVLVLDEAGRIQRMNESAWRQLGGPRRGELPIDEVSPLLAQGWHRWREGGQQPGAPTSLAEGTVPSLPRFIRLFAENNDLTVVFLEDIVLLNQHAEALTLDTLGRLSASIAHELRNPLGAIRQAGQLLGEAPDLPDRHRKLIGIIDKHSQRLEHIVRGVLDLAKRERARPDVININSWLATQIEEFRLTRLPEGDLLDLQLPTATSEILFDPVHLDQVVGNLLGNAINYGRPAVGPLEITVSLSVSANEPPRLLIADNGSGIPADKIELAFKPFYTTGKGGTGLGLYLCRQLCEANSATLDYDSQPGRGAGFVVRFHRPVIFGN
ncbi:MAG: HAMP domain-containing histidine kinase [Xanthomonadales bacterium]|nr:HAMP domain-containing histidine kinase [Xanthomonadales bacterium]